jgi:hypothetical protein
MSACKTFAIALVCACTSLAASAHNGVKIPTRHVKAHKFYKGIVPTMKPNNPRLVEARKEAEAEDKGIVTPKALATSNGGWKIKRTFYVGCSGEPGASSFTTIQDAVATAELYTLIKVCPGTYDTSGDNAVVISKSYIEVEGVSSHSGAETVSCGDTPNPEDGSAAFVILASHDILKNLTINNCGYGVQTGEESEIRSTEILTSFFNGNFEGVGLNIGYQTEIQGNKFEDNVFPIFDYGGIKDVISGNTITGDTSGEEDGIASQFTVSSKISNNTVTGAFAGLDFAPFNPNQRTADTAKAKPADVEPVEGQGFNTGADVTSNHFNENVIGVLLGANDSGNKLVSNYANSNGIGFYSDETSGAFAFPDAGTNRLEKNSAKGNSEVDYVDETYGYSGADPEVTNGTADYYYKNKGCTAYPSSLVISSGCTIVTK